MLKLLKLCCRTGKIIGICIGTKISLKLGYIAVYVVHPDYQGKGIGSQLWEKCMKRCANLNTCTGAVENMHQKYHSVWKFNEIPERRFLKYQKEGKIMFENLITAMDGVVIELINASNIDKVINYDNLVCGFEREKFLKLMTEKRDDVVAITARDLSGNILGYGVFQTSLVGALKCEPIYADNEQIAELLIANGCEKLPGTTEIGAIMTVWSTNLNAQKLAEKMGLKLKSEWSTMFTEYDIKIDLEKIYAISSICFYPF